LAAVALIVTVSSRLEARAGILSAVTSERVAARAPSPRARVALAASLTGGAVLLGAPLAALAWRSLDTPNGFGLSFYRSLGAETPALLVAPWRAVVNSLVYATAATAVALVIGGLAAAVIAHRRTSWLDTVVMLPLGASAVM